MLKSEIKRRQLQFVVQLWLHHCSCPGKEWQPAYDNYKLDRHTEVCKFRVQVEREFQSR